MKARDPERVEKRISSMRGALGLLRELRDLPVEAFLSDPHKQSSAKYNCTAATEATIDIASQSSRGGLCVRQKTMQTPFKFCARPASCRPISPLN